jgi:histidinol-phosphate aminotransferase
MAPMPIRPDVAALPGYHFTPRDQPVKLDQNESPWDLPEPLRTRALERVAVAPFHRYPELHADRLRARLAALHGWPETGVVVAAGSNVLIQAAAIVAGLGRRVLSVTPSFSVYVLQARLLGAALREVPLAAGFALPRDGLLTELGGGEGVHFLAAPMAPTGNAVAEADVRALAEAGAPRWLTVIDEAYGAFAGSDFADVARSVPGAVSLRTLSKAFGLAGVRLGYALATPAVARELQKAVLPFSVSVLQLALVEAVLEEPTFVAERVASIRAERERLAAALRQRPGVEVFDSVTNFVLLRVRDAAGTHAGLLEQGVVVRRQDHLPGLQGCLRVTAGTPRENDAFLTALDAVLAAAGTTPEGARHAHA